jgi:hypothetical protein
MADYLLLHQAFGADILEVGYDSRGGCDLEHHLETWDKLTANGLFLYGNGVSDSHGGLWMEQSSVYHTWIYADGNSEEELLSALARGKMCFGNLALFQGSFWYKIGNLEVGDRGFSHTNLIAPDFHLTSAPPGSKIRITQGLLDSKPDVTYIYRDLEIDMNAIPLIDCTKPSFVRFGVYDASGNPLIFGEPVVIFGTLNDTSGTGNSMHLHTLLYPNPADEQFFLSMTVYTPESLQIRILDTGGRKIDVIADRYFYRGKYGFAIASGHLAQGNYILEISGGQTKMVRQFIIR